MNNRISFTLTQTAITNINTAIDTINTNLNMLVALAPGESKGLQGVDSGRYLFVKKCSELVDNNNIFKPEFFDPVEAKKDILFFEQLGPFESRLTDICRKISDTRLIVGHESYTFSRAVYEKIQSGAKKSIPGFKAAYEELKPFFEKMGNKKKESQKMKSAGNKEE